MFGALFLTLGIALVGIVLHLLGLLAQETYGGNLEQYILSHNPQHPSDVERLTIEYQRKQERNFL